jgi:hypothetical protein
MQVSTSRIYHVSSWSRKVIVTSYLVAWMVYNDLGYYYRSNDARFARAQNDTHNNIGFNQLLPTHISTSLDLRLVSIESDVGKRCCL